MMLLWIFYLRGCFVLWFVRIEVFRLVGNVWNFVRILLGVLLVSCVFLVCVMSRFFCR